MRKQCKLCPWKISTDAADERKAFGSHSTPKGSSRRLTRQGVRDLNYVGPKIGEKVTVIDFVEGRVEATFVTAVRARPDRFVVQSGLIFVVAEREWARGWDTEEAKALRVAEALA